MPTIPTGKMERELRRLYMQWVHQLPQHERDLHDYVAKFQRQSTDLIEKMGGDVARLGVMADFPAPRRLDLSLHVGTIYSDMELAAISAQIGTGLNPTDTARALVRAGVDKSYRRLERLARTETVRAYWKNSWDSIDGLGLVMLWGSEDGPRTCAWCRERDGLVMDSSQLRDHPNGRCTPIPMHPAMVEYKGSIRADGTIYQDPAWTKPSQISVKAPRSADEFTNDASISSEGVSFGDASWQRYRSTFSDIENEAINAYTAGGSFFDVKKAYLDGTPYTLSDGSDIKDVLGKVFERTAITEDTTLYRGMHVSKGWLDAHGVGESIDHKFYISTSSDSAVNSAFGAGKKANVVLKILTPKGTPVVPGATDLNELVLKPDTRMVVRRVAKLSNKTLLEVEIIP